MNSALLTITSIHLMALASPGPDFFLVLRYAMGYNLRRSLLCILGITCGITTHVSLAYFGIAFLIQRSPLIYNIIVLLGICWLVRIALTMLFARPTPTTQNQTQETRSPHNAFINGYFTNLLNPKAFIYFTSVLSPLVGSSHASFPLLIAIFTTTSFCWFATVSLLLFIPLIKKHIITYTFKIEKIFGLLLLIMAIFLFKLVIL